MVTRELIIGWQVMVDNWMMVFSWLANSCKQMVGLYLPMGGGCMEDCLQIFGLCLVYGFKMVDRASRWLAYGRK